ncbi:MAG: hypothetical protein ACRDJP_04870, partial [Actinomycetota bacterium]
MGWADEDPGLPIKFGPVSNGEYDPHPLSPVLLETIRRAREECDRNAGRLGMSRRRFLLSLAGAATTLSVLNACTREAAKREGRAPGGGYEIAPEATLDEDVAMEEIGGDEFVFDVQGHLLEYDLNPAVNDPHRFWSRFPQQGCGEDDPRDCYSIEHFMEEMFLKSDTSMVVVSSLPLPPDGPLSLDVIAETARVATALCRDERVLLHGNPFPNIGPFDRNAEQMADAVAGHPIAAWKVFTNYPHLWDGSGNQWWFDDHDPSLPQVGGRFIETSLDLGVRTIAVHKGLSGETRNASPEDIGPAARMHPDMRFVVYHSGYE